MSKQLVTVKTFEFLPEAEAAKLHLATEGITACLSDAALVNADWFLGNAVGYIKLQVLSDQAERAAELLEGHGPERGERSNDDRAEGERCLSCGAAIAPGETSCSSCGWTYSEENEENDDPSNDGPNEPRVRAEQHEDGPSGMDTLRKMKKPILLLFLLPSLAGGLTFAAYLVMRVIDFLVEW